MKSTQDRINYLKKCAKLYETNGTSPITDEEYDKEYYVLKEIEPNNAFFSEVGGIEEELIYGKKVKHEVIMGSLNKSPDIEDFETWLNNTYKGQEQDFISGKLSFILQYKIDGSSLGCLYKDGKLVQVLTRGDGEKGIDISENGKYVDGILHTIDYKDEIEFRGECYKDKKDFYESWAGEYKNPRNYTAGSLNNKDPLIVKERGLSFICYEVVRKDFASETEKMKVINALGFKNISSSTVTTSGSFKKICEDVKKFMDNIDRPNLPFDIDGVVVKLVQIPIAKEMGYTSEGKKPKANRAVKFLCEQKTTVLKSVEFGIGRTGNLTLVGILEPVELAGTTVSRVTLHNPKFVQEMGINIGSKLLIQKSGDIIPYVVKKIASGKKEIDIPDYCPCCSGKLEWDDNKVTLHCNNNDCPSQFQQRIEKYFKTVGVMGLGEGIITRLLQLKDKNEKPIVSSIADMYILEKHTEILSQEFGPKATQNMLNSIASIKEVTLDQLVEAMGIAKIGSMAKDVVKIAPTIKDIDCLTVEQLLTIDGFASIKAECFVDGWLKIKKDVGYILKHVSIKTKELNSMKLSGKKICFTGSFKDPTRKEMEQMVEDNGGSLTSVGKNLTALVWDGEMNGNKIEKANKLGLKIINQKEFMDMLK
jgi:DNA ligase (NAD+)